MTEEQEKWYERETAAFRAWWEAYGEKTYSETPTMAAGAGWLKRAEAASSETRTTISTDSVVEDKTTMVTTGDVGSTPTAVHPICSGDLGTQREIAAASSATRTPVAWRYVHKESRKETFSNQPPDRVLFSESYEITDLYE